MLPANWINLIAFVLCDIVNIIKSPWHRQSYVLYINKSCNELSLVANNSHCDDSKAVHEYMILCGLQRFTANVYRQMTDKLMFKSVISTVR